VRPATAHESDQKPGGETMLKKKHSEPRIDCSAEEWVARVELA
jgi:hypothetical protein